MLKEADTHELRNLNMSWNNLNSDSNVLTQSGNNRSTLFHAVSTRTMALMGSGPKRGILSRPHDPAEPCTPVEAPPQSSSLFVTPLPCYTLLRSMERSTLSAYSNYVPLYLRLLLLPFCSDYLSYLVPFID